MIQALNNRSLLRKFGSAQGVKELQTRFEASIEQTKDIGVTLDDVLTIEKSGKKKVLFSELAMQEMAALGDHAEEFAKRPEVKGVTLTIDSYASQDLDDGLSYYRNKDGSFVVGISITDVSAWVPRGGALDHSARLRVAGDYRGKSELVAPMFPLPLANDTLSLHQDRPRLCKTVEMLFSPSGKFLDAKIFRSVFINRHRLDSKDAARARDTAPTSEDGRAVQEALQAFSLAAGGKEGELPNIEKMLERLVRRSCLFVADALKNAGLEASYRNQESQHSPAHYDAQPTGHAGIGAEAYVQWTSPIRRYADLDTHRALDRLLDGKKPRGKIAEIAHRNRESQHERDNKGRDRRYKVLSLLVRLAKSKKTATLET